MCLYFTCNTYVSVCVCVCIYIYMYIDLKLRMTDQQVSIYEKCSPVIVPCLYKCEFQF